MPFGRPFDHATMKDRIDRLGAGMGETVQIRMLEAQISVLEAQQTPDAEAQVAALEARLAALEAR
jgi:hypothetical protein